MNLEIILISGLLALILLDNNRWFQTGASRPLMISVIFSLIVKNPYFVYVGIIYELLWLNAMPIGTKNRPSSTISCAVSLITQYMCVTKTGMMFFFPVLTLNILIAVLLLLVHPRITFFIKYKSEDISRIIKLKILKRNFQHFTFLILLPGIITFFIFWAEIILFSYISYRLLALILPRLTMTAITSLNFSYYLFFLTGIGVIMNLMLVKIYLRYMLLGLALAFCLVYLNIPVILSFLILIAVVLMYQIIIGYKKSKVIEKIKEYRRDLKDPSLTKKQLLITVFRTFFIQAAWNFKYMLGVGIVYAVYYPLSILIKDKKQLSKALLKYFKFFNSHPYLTNYIVGLIIRIEELKLKGYNDCEPVVDVMPKTSAAPLAAIGGEFFWETVRPFAALAGIIITLILPLDYFYAGAAVYFLIFNYYHLYIRIHGVFTGYFYGEHYFVLYTKKLKEMINVFHKISLITIGGFAVYAPYFITRNFLNLHHMFDLAYYFIMVIFIVGFIAFIVYALKKEISVLRLIYTQAVFAFIGSLLYYTYGW